jgi:hypothetical protein
MAVGRADRSGAPLSSAGEADAAQAKTIAPSAIDGRRLRREGGMEEDETTGRENESRRGPGLFVGVAS